MGLYTKERKGWKVEECLVASSALCIVRKRPERWARKVPVEGRAEGPGTLTRASSVSGRVEARKMWPEKWTQSEETEQFFSRDAAVRGGKRWTSG